MASKTILGAASTLMDTIIKNRVGIIGKVEELPFVVILHIEEPREFQGSTNEGIPGVQLQVLRIYEEPQLQFQCYAIGPEAAEALADKVKDKFDGYVADLESKRCSPFTGTKSNVMVCEEMSSSAEFVYLVSLTYYVQTSYSLQNGQRVKP